VNGLRNDLSVRNTIASQLIRYYLSRFSLVIFQQPPEETLGSRAITTGLKKYINNLTILINSPPQVLLFTSCLYENLVNVECIAEPLMPFLQSLGILRTELVAP